MSKNSITKSFAWKLLERSSVQVINLIVQVVLARLVAPEEFGKLAILLVFYNIIDIFVQKGFGSSLIRKKEITKYDLDTVFVVSCTIAIMLVIIVQIITPYIGIYFCDNSIVLPLRVLSLALLLSPFFCIFNSLLIREMNFKVIFTRGIISAIISGVVGIWMAIENFALWSLVAQIVTNQLILIMIMSFGINYRIGFSFRRSSFLEVFSFGKNVLLTELLLYAVESIRTMSIGKVYTSSQLAYYDRGQTYPALMMNTINDTFFSVLLPHFSKYQDDSEILKVKYIESLKILIFIVVPIFMGFAAVSKEFTLSVLTEQWLATVPFIIVFCLYQTIFPYQTISKVILYAKGESSIVWRIEIWKSLLSISLMVLSLSLGTIYVAASLIIVRLFCVILYLIRIKKYFENIEIVKQTYKPFISSVLMFLIVFHVDFGITNQWYVMLSKIFIGILLYLLSELIIDGAFIIRAISVLKNRIKI